MPALLRPYRVWATVVIWGAFTIILTSFLTTLVTSESDTADPSPVAAPSAPLVGEGSESDGGSSPDLDGDEVVLIVLLIAVATVVGTIMVWAGDWIESRNKRTTGTNPGRSDTGYGP
jgi:hypothetical protein